MTPFWDSFVYEATSAGDKITDLSQRLVKAIYDRNMLIRCSSKAVECCWGVVVAAIQITSRLPAGNSLCLRCAVQLVAVNVLQKKGAGFHTSTSTLSDDSTDGNSIASFNAGSALLHASLAAAVFSFSLRCLCRNIDKAIGRQRCQANHHSVGVWDLGSQPRLHVFFSSQLCWVSPP